jgi:hypothetical protein
MLTSFRFWMVIGAIVAIAGAFWSRSPYGTVLPLEVEDLTPIQEQLEQLPDEERELVLGYLRRSNGDVLPASFADPDQPFTARTFREAIALQKDFLAKQSVSDREADARRADREALMAPLRKVSSVRVLKREILTGDEIYGRPAASDYATRKSTASTASSGNKVLVVTYRLHNLSPRAIASIQGSVSILSAAGEEMTDCFFDHGESIGAGSSADIRCGQPNLPASVNDIAFTAMPMSDFTVYWEPRTIAFADGTRIATGL